jgi:hypothetical protein
MWRLLQRLFSRPLKPADKLLNHLDRLAGTEARFVRVSDDGAEPGMFVAIYQGFPTPEALTGFTIGLSHFHPPQGAHKELTISMCAADDAWALACGYLAFQMRATCRFACGDTINFREPIAKSSAMSAFVVVHPLHITSQDCVVDLGVRRVEIVQLVPIYEQEHAWFGRGGDLKLFLQAFPDTALMDPRRNAFAGSA